MHLYGNVTNAHGAVRPGKPVSKVALALEPLACMPGGRVRRMVLLPSVVNRRTRAK
jgi:hypothetical protein